MSHLIDLKVIADYNNRTRHLGSNGFKATLDYLEAQLRLKTNFHIFRQEFSVPVRISNNPILMSSIHGMNKNYTYNTDFREVSFSPTANFIDPIRLTLVPNFGCNERDWENTSPHPAMNSVALVKYSINCSTAVKSILAQKYNISGLLIYNSDNNATDLPVTVISRNVTFPAMVLSYEIGVELVDAIKNHSTTNVSVRIFIPLENSILLPILSENLCADTPTGHKNQTIVIGSHSDSIENTSGINDNGSGAMATLVLALNLAKLFQTSYYEKYLYRIRFCWWGAEENNLLGSHHHVEQANITTIEGNRLKDYLLVLNFDMLASSNYYFGVYEAGSLPDKISSKVKNGTNKISQVFRDWFDKNHLPWDNSSPILSDYVPFLFAGIPCGGTFSGADTVKTIEQRNRYNEMLGHGYGGIAEAKYDSCYHKECDTIENINLFGYEIMVKSAAYALETRARQPNLDEWLYE